MKLLFILLILCFSQPVFSIGSIVKPDYVTIKKLTNDSTSTFYYPSLFKRYMANDTSLSQEDYTMLYFGYFFQSGYLATGRNSTYNDTLGSILSKEILSKSDWKRVITYIYKYIDISPFDLEKLNILFIAYHNINDEYYAMKFRNKLEMLIKTILLTGDGKTSKTGYHVLKLDDEYALLSVLGYEFTGDQTHTDDNCDYLYVSKNPDGLQGIYFDVNQVIINLKQKQPR